ncbi:MAG: hypothetical protein R2851_00975 [Caldilineaceae bacterium]
MLATACGKERRGSHWPISAVSPGRLAASKPSMLNTRAKAIHAKIMGVRRDDEFCIDLISYFIAA